MRVGTLVKHYAVEEDSPIGLGIVVKVHELLDYYGYKRVDVLWLNSNSLITTENIKILREVKCK